MEIKFSQSFWHRFIVESIFSLLNGFELPFFLLFYIKAEAKKYQIQSMRFQSENGRRRRSPMELVATL